VNRSDLICREIRWLSAARPAGTAVRLPVPLLDEGRGGSGIKGGPRARRAAIAVATLEAGGAAHSPGAARVEGPVHAALPSWCGSVSCSVARRVALANS
jgi:hypothetical protein